MDFITDIPTDIIYKKIKFWCKWVHHPLTQKSILK